MMFETSRVRITLLILAAVLTQCDAVNPDATTYEPCKKCGEWLDQAKLTRGKCKNCFYVAGVESATTAKMMLLGAKIASQHRQQTHPAFAHLGAMTAFKAKACFADPTGTAAT